MPDPAAHRPPSPAAAGRPLRRVLTEERAALLAYVERRLPASLRGAVDPADVVQDVCIEALRREAAYRPADDPGGRRWLFTIARRRLIRLLERARVARQRTEAGLPADAAADPVVGLLEQLAVYERTPSQSAAAHEQMAMLQAAIGRLRPDHAAVVRLRHVERMSATAAAGLTGRSPGAVDKLLQRAMAALRSELQPRRSRRRG